MNVKRVGFIKKDCVYFGIVDYRVVNMMKNEARKSMVFGAVILLIFGFALSGCLNGYDELELKEIKFVEDLDSLEEVEPNYEPEDHVYMYLKVEGFEADDEIVKWSVYVTVRDPDGNVYDRLNRSEQANNSEDIGGEWGVVESIPDFSPPEEGWNEGENEVEIEVIDRVGDKNLIAKERIEVE